MRSAVASLALLLAVLCGVVAWPSARHAPASVVLPAVASAPPSTAARTPVKPHRATSHPAHTTALVHRAATSPRPASPPAQPKPPAVTTTVPAPPAPKPATVLAAATKPAPAPVHATTESSSTTSSSGGCAAAVSYLAGHAAPGFQFQCPGYALGHQAMTCVNVPGVCSGEKIIVISVACPASWMNEASNSWVLTGRSDARIDPYGYCS